MDKLEARVAALEAERPRLIAASMLLAQLLGWLRRTDPHAFERFEAGLIAVQSEAAQEDDPLLHECVQRALEVLDEVRSPSP